MDILINVLEGVGSIIVASLLLLIPQVREFIIKSYQNSLDKALEDKKASNERKNYVSKVRFDKEFFIFQELSEMIFKINACTNQIDINKYLHDAETNRKTYSNLIICFNHLENFLFKNIAFINKELAKMYVDFHELTLEIIIDNRNEKEDVRKIETYLDYLKSNGGQMELHPNKINLKDIKLSEKHQKLSDLYEEITAELRIYLQNLEVKE